MEHLVLFGAEVFSLQCLDCLAGLLRTLPFKPYMWKVRATMLVDSFFATLVMFACKKNPQNKWRKNNSTPGTAAAARSATCTAAATRSTTSRQASHVARSLAASLTRGVAWWHLVFGAAYGFEILGLMMHAAWFITSSSSGSCNSACWDCPSNTGWWCSAWHCPIRSSYWKNCKG